MMSTAPSSTDVFVVGGGPAGLAAAIAARQQGFHVTVADCARPPIDKACGEGLMPNSVAALHELGVDLDGAATGTFRGIRFFGGEGIVDGDFPRGRGLGIRRTLLQEALLQRAQDCGVIMLWGALVSEARPGAVLVDGHAVPCRWIIGADGQNSRVRLWAGLTAGHDYECRIGLRRHFAIRPWSEFVEIYWGASSEVYITPVGENQVGVALLSKQRTGDFASALEEFPALKRRLGSAPATTAVKGAATVTRRLKSVTRGRFALVGDASGSVDAITGEGIGMAFHQALALGRALAANDLALYEAAHRQIRELPHFMARTLLLMDKNRWVRDHTLRALSAKPALFRRLLAVHVGELPLAKFGIPGFFDLGWQMLTVRAAGWQE
jgi:menaquinone-9 beta-reductase